MEYQFNSLNVIPPKCILSLECVLVNLLKHPCPKTVIVDNIKAIVHSPYINVQFNTKVFLISIT